MAATKEDKAAAEREEALRVDKQSAPTTGQTTYIDPDLSFTEGHGDPEEWSGPEKQWREARDTAREEGVQAALEAEQQFAEENAKAAEEEAVASAEQRKAQANLQTALAGLVATASSPTTAPAASSGQTASKASS